MDTIRPIPSAQTSKRRPRPASHLDRSLLALVVAPRMTETEAAAYARGQKSAVAGPVAAWMFAMLAVYLLASVIEPHVFAVRAEISTSGTLYYRTIPEYTAWVNVATTAWGLLLAATVMAIPFRAYRWLAAQGGLVLGAAHLFSSSSIATRFVVLFLLAIAIAFGVMLSTKVPAMLITEGLQSLGLIP